MHLSSGIPDGRTPRVSRRVMTGVVVLLAWAVAAYLLIPGLTKLYFRNHFDGGPRITHTADGHPGDPINIAVEGSEEELVRAMQAAGWYPADPITLDTSVRIAVDSVVRKPDDEAPVSNLFLFGRKQDLAYELPVGNSPRQRHHVRFWRWDKLEDGRPVWFGAATFDERVGLSHANAQVTHHIGPDVDAERGLIMAGLRKAGWTEDEYFIDGFHKNLEGRNGGGDLWRTDGRLGAVVLKNGVSGTDQKRPPIPAGRPIRSG